MESAIEIVIDEQGSVAAATLLRATQSNFDEALLKAARGWKFRPALLNGTPVLFRKVIEIHIQPDR